MIARLRICLLRRRLLRRDTVDKEARQLAEDLLTSYFRKNAKSPIQQRSVTIFLDHLTREQKFKFVKSSGCVEVKGSNGLIYTIRPYCTGNVSVKGIHYCAAPVAAYTLPPFDVMLAQKLLIETDALAFHQCAFPRQLPWDLLRDP